MKSGRMKSVGVAGLIAAVSFVMTSCLDNDATPQPTIPVAYVSLYNESPNAPDLKFLVDNNQVNSRPFAYSDYSTYLPFYTGDRSISVGPFGASNVVLDTTVTLLEKKYYSIFVVDDYSQAEVLVLGDSGQEPAAGKAKIRFVNLSPDAGTVQLKSADAAITAGEGFKVATPFMEVDAKTTSFTVSSADASVNLNVPSIMLQSGRFYTLLVRGYKTPPSGNTNVLSAEVVTN